MVDLVLLSPFTGFSFLTTTGVLAWKADAGAFLKTFGLSISTEIFFYFIYFTFVALLLDLITLGSESLDLGLTKASGL